MIKVICVGKIKERYLVEAINDYIKRLSKYTKLKIIEVESFEYDDISRNLKEESNGIIKYIDPKEHIIILDTNGTELSSKEFSNKIYNILSNKNITFVIGGSNGVDNLLKNMSNDILSFSKFTFPHQLFRLVFFEQLYRAFKIINNETYHKWGVKCLEIVGIKF